MVYATFEDIVRKPVETSEMERCEALLEDAGIIIDAFNAKAAAESKRFVSCNMVIRVLGSGDEGVPIGTTQATASALGYSQSWTNANGSGELYLTKLDKKILGTGNRIGYTDPYQDLVQTEEG